MKTKSLFCFVMGMLIILVLGSSGRQYIYNIDGERVNPGQIHSAQEGWVKAGTFTTVTTTPDATHRTAALFTADANNVVFEIPAKWNAVRVRVSSTTDGDSSVFDMFLMNGDADHFNRIQTTTWTTGTQTAGTAGSEFADTVVRSNTNWHKSSAIMSPEGNYIAEWIIDVIGSKKVGFSPTTITNTAIIEITGG